MGSHRCKFWRWQKNDALQLIDEREVPAAPEEKYTLKVVAIDSWILCYVNDLLVASTGDYVLQPGNRGQNTVIKEGCFGILNWNSKGSSIVWGRGRTAAQLLLNAFRLNINPWFYQGWVKKPWQIKTSMLR